MPHRHPVLSDLSHSQLRTVFLIRFLCGLSAFTPARMDNVKTSCQVVTIYHDGTQGDAPTFYVWLN